MRTACVTDSLPPITSSIKGCHFQDAAVVSPLSHASVLTPVVGHFRSSGGRTGWGHFPVLVSPAKYLMNTNGSQQWNGLTVYQPIVAKQKRFDMMCYISQQRSKSTKFTTNPAWCPLLMLTLYHNNFLYRNKPRNAQISNH